MFFFIFSPASSGAVRSIILEAFLSWYLKSFMLTDYCVGNKLLPDLS